MKPTDIINHSLYPIDDHQSDQRQATIERIREQLRQDGCAVIQNFLSETGLSALTAEALQRQSTAYYSPRKLCNVYLNDGNPDFPDDPR